MSDHSTQSDDRRALRLDPSPRGFPGSRAGAPVAGPHLDAQKAAHNDPHAITCEYCRRVITDNGHYVITCECGHNIVVSDAPP